MLSALKNKIPHLFLACKSRSYKDLCTEGCRKFSIVAGKAREGIPVPIMKRNIELTKQEKEIEDALIAGEFVSVDDRELEKYLKQSQGGKRMRY